MRILLIEPPKSPLTIGGEDIFLFEPLALEYVGSGVSREHEVRLLDMRLDKRLDRMLEVFRPQIVGITSYTVHVNTVKRLFARIKDWDRTVLTVVGGHHATVRAEDFDTSSIDLVVAGEGVAAFAEIVNREGKGASFEGISGVNVRGERGAGKEYDVAPVADLDSFPFPDRSLSAAYRRHYFSEWMKPLASMRTSKGCPHRCSFCALWKLTGGKYLKRDPHKIVEELSSIKEPFVFFADDESLVDAPRMEELARLIQEAGINKKYFMYGRADTITRHPSLLKAWRDIGLERVFVGLEFVRDADLKSISKGSTAADNEKAIRVLSELGIDIYASFIIRPEFTKEDFAALKDYCHSMDIGFASFSVLTPLPGTDFYSDVRDRLTTSTCDYFDFVHTVLPTTLPIKEFYARCADLHAGSLPPRRRLALMRKIPMGDLPGTLWRFGKFLRRIRGADGDTAAARATSLSG